MNLSMSSPKLNFESAIKMQEDREQGYKSIIEYPHVGVYEGTVSKKKGYEVPSGKNKMRLGSSKQTQKELEK